MLNTPKDRQWATCKGRLQSDWRMVQNTSVGNEKCKESSHDRFWAVVCYAGIKEWQPWNGAADSIYMGWEKGTLFTSRGQGYYKNDRETREGGR